MKTHHRRYKQKVRESNWPWDIDSKYHMAKRFAMLTRRDLYHIVDAGRKIWDCLPAGNDKIPIETAYNIMVELYNDRMITKEEMQKAHRRFEILFTVAKYLVLLDDSY